MCKTLVNLYGGPLCKRMCLRAYMSTHALQTPQSMPANMFGQISTGLHLHSLQIPKYTVSHWVNLGAPSRADGCCPCTLQRDDDDDDDDDDGTGFTQE